MEIFKKEKELAQKIKDEMVEGTDTSEIIQITNELYMRRDILKGEYMNLEWADLFDVVMKKYHKYKKEEEK